VATLWGLRSNARLRFQASTPGWAFHPLDAELALREQLQHHHDFHLDHHHLDRRPQVQWHPRELPAVPEH